MYVEIHSEWTVLTFYEHESIIQLYLVQIMAHFYSVTHTLNMFLNLSEELMKNCYYVIVYKHFMKSLEHHRFTLFIPNERNFWNSKNQIIDLSLIPLRELGGVS